MKTLSRLLVCLAVAIPAASVCAQSAVAPASTFADPANLMGERERPRDGRELEIDKGTRGLEQMLRRINTRASLMLIVAHPDDEDGGMLTLYARGLGARVADLSLTRGEGGQNAMTGDFEDALGLLRTQELLASDRYSGVDQFFGTEVDFGFSKTKEEAFAKWTHERVLYDAVRAVRLYRPLVIAAVFLGGVTDGHGQHQVSGQIAQEVFTAAGDPKVFPEMIAEGILPWSPLKVYARVPRQAITQQGLFDYATGQYTAPRFVNYVTGEITTTVPTTDVTVHEGDADALLSAPGEPARSYVQFARLGLGLQHSQIPVGFRVPPAGVFDVPYHRYGSRLAQQPEIEQSFFAGIDTTLAGIASLAPSAPPELLRQPLERLASLIANASSHLERTHAETSAPALAAVQQQLSALIGRVEAAALPAQERFDVLHELRVKSVQINDALALALGVSLEAVEESQPQTRKPAVFPANESTPVNVTLGSVVWTVTRTDWGVAASGVKPAITERAIELGAGLQATRPYFGRSSVEQPYYDLYEPALRNAPLAPPALIVNDEVPYRGVTVHMRSAITAATQLPDGSIFRQPLWIVPPVSLALTPAATVLSTSETAMRQGVPVEATVKTASTAPATVRMQVPTDWSIAERGEHTTLDTTTTRFLLRPPAGFSAQRLVASTSSAQGGAIREGYRSVGYPGLAIANLYRPAATRVVPVDLQLPPGRRVGYIAGTGDAVPQALTSIGLEVEMLSVRDLTAARLRAFDAVVLGVRTYAAHPELHGAPTAALLEYVRLGGVVVVQYQSAEFTGDDAPYPLTLGSDAEKVVDETAAVQLLPPATALLATPNAVTPHDFDGWIEERGHGFLRNWDPHYAALTETHDPDQTPQRGGLVTVALGSGRWTYCAFALYRQMPEAVPGAYRLFVDLLQR